MPTKEEIKQLNKTIEEKYGKYSFTPIITPDIYERLSAIGKNACLNTYGMYSTLQPFISKTIFETTNLIEKCRPLYMDAMEKYRPYIIQQTHFLNKVSKSIDLQKLANSISKLANPLTDISKIWISNYTDTFDKIRKLIKDLQQIPEFDFSTVNKQFKKACLIMLKNGYYPSRRVSIRMVNITQISNTKNLNTFICNEIDKTVKRDKKRIIRSLKKNNKVIKEIFKLYENVDYRLCILSIINLLSIIYNSNFDNTDFTEGELKNKLKNLGLLDDVNIKYSIFAPYYAKKGDNKLLASHINEKEKYKKVPYCRNAILHGYSVRFGNKRNTLRWFSVLLNTIDLLEAVEEKNKSNN